MRAAPGADVGYVGGRLSGVPGALRITNTNGGFFTSLSNGDLTAKLALQLDARPDDQSKRVHPVAAFPGNHGFHVPWLLMTKGTFAPDPTALIVGAVVMVIGYNVQRSI